MEDRRRLVNSVCSPRVTPYVRRVISTEGPTPKVGAKPSNASSSDPGKALSSPPSVVNSSIGNNLLAQGPQALIPAQYTMHPQLAAELKYWKQMLSFLNDEWIPLLRFMHANGRINEPNYKAEDEPQVLRIGALTTLISALESMGQTVVASTLHIDAQNGVESALSVWNSLMPKRIHFAFEHTHQISKSKLAEILLLEDTGK